jgi:cyclopropane fatty-acyl-phospholipid synthase-like methyltransferase
MSGFYYDLLIGDQQTKFSYKKMIEKCNPNSKILDIGSGDGKQLLTLFQMIKDKSLLITCLDNDKESIKILNNNVKKFELNDNITTLHEDVYNVTNFDYDYIFINTTLICLDDEFLKTIYCNVKEKTKIFVSQAVYNENIFDKTLLLVRQIISYFYPLPVFLSFKRLNTMINDKYTINSIETINHGFFSSFANFYIIELKVKQ